MTTTTAPRTYGNFKPARRRLIGGMGPLGVAVAAAFAMLTLFTLSVIGFQAAIVVAVFGVVVVVPLMVRWGGRTIAERVARRALVGLGRLGRQHVYRAGVVSRIPGRTRLPGLLHDSQVVEVETGRADYPRVGIVILPRVKHFSVSLRCDTSGTDLVDSETIDTWVARTGGWLRSLSEEPGLIQAQVTVETAPDPGTRLAAAVSAQVTDAAPDLARSVLEQVVSEYPRAAPQVDTRVTLTWALPKPRRPRSGGPRRAMTPDEMCVRIASRLPGLMEMLRGTGAGDTRPMAPEELAAVCRSAYDPAAASLLSTDSAEAVAWVDAGPVAAHEEWDHYRHDSGVSMSWGLAEAPRGIIHATVLPRLMAATPGLLRKRVTMVWHPMTPEQAANAVDMDVRDARFRAAQKARPGARELADIASANAVAAAEAEGEGQIRFSLMVTATVGSVDELDAAEDTVRQLSASTRLRLRPQYGSQAAAFAAGLPVGVVLSRHAHIPS
ncbi:hypothetical protein AMIS_12800 [Actinoplanes missouriensis 431]|uniref:Integral membrane protein n=1 Tax=Actinoplanes missouriensis (strain ATCC 14538 / DSM 43046 / CBS 188.64 / JCM 3121 / NBRC 102363 / NCIMB 12654 / NRRL B-3342 / UNCC 431) TaxID=512565 RepID=I0H0G3_ACTM4|nr:SCO6880 family protein [Actinoplanes missouriensis]BAL86500.1 hypothetical protein AMIS_12800 [Actinoplanes missouriensis 431]